MSRYMSIKTAVILAGGLGLRLRPITNKIPKPMVLIRGKPLLEWQMEWLQRHGVERFVLATGYMWEKIKDHFDKKELDGIVYSVEDRPLGTAGAIKLAASKFDDEEFFVLNGDIICNADLGDMARFHREMNSKLTLMVVPFVSPYGMIEISGNRVSRFVEKPAIPGLYINGGVYLMNREVVRVIPEKGDIEQTTFPKLSEMGVIYAYRYEGFWRSLDTLKDLKAIEREKVIADEGSGPDTDLQRKG